MRKRFMATAASFCKDPSGALRHLPLQGRLTGYHIKCNT